MLVDLHIKNVALIKESEISFGEGLNILTGETVPANLWSLTACSLHWAAERERISCAMGKKQLQ